MKVVVELDSSERKASFENARRVQVPVPGEDAIVIRIDQADGEMSVFIDDPLAETECVWSTLLRDG